MLQALFAGVSGLDAHQTRMNVIGNNIANVNTTAFKAGSVSFEDQLSQTIQSATAPANGLGGTNPVQAGLGVALASIGALQTEGNLETTGKTTDLAIQGNGLFVVSDGSRLQFQRDGSFDLDASGTLVNSASGLKLIGYKADDQGTIDLSAPLTATSSITVPLGTSLPARPTNNIKLEGNLNTGDHNYSTYLNFGGNLSSAASSGTVNNLTTLYDADGAAHSVQTTFLNPATDANGNKQWDVQISVDSRSVYDSTGTDPKLSYLPAQGWTFVNGAGNAQPPLDLTIPGTGALAPFQVRVNLGSLTNSTATSSVSGVADGSSSGTSNWGNSVTIYDGLGNSHVISFKYTHVPLASSPAPPTVATNQWNWAAVDENGTQVGNSSTSGNTPLYFDNSGNPVGQFTQNIQLALNPNNGSASPVNIALDTTKTKQTSSDSSVAGAQDGYPSGILQSYAISTDGVISGNFSSGESRALGQIALATFANPGGLDKQGNNILAQSNNSGIPQIGVANQNGRGKLASGYLEMSNVDLATEFTNLIITQRGFQANTRIISTVDAMMQDVLNLKQ